MTGSECPVCSKSFGTGDWFHRMVQQLAMRGDTVPVRCPNCQAPAAPRGYLQ